MSIIKRHVTLASEPQGITGVYATSCHWATLRRLHSPGTMGSHVPDFTTDSEAMLTVGPDVRVGPGSAAGNHDTGEQNADRSGGQGATIPQARRHSRSFDCVALRTSHLDATI